MFQQNREQSQTYISSSLKNPDVNGNQNLRTSQLMNDSLGSLGSMTMGQAHMSSVGMGSTNIAPMNATNVNTNANANANVGNIQANASADIKAQQERVVNMQHRMSGMGLDPLLVSDNSLMIMLAEAAANSESLGSTFSFKSSIEPDLFAGSARTPRTDMVSSSGNPAMSGGRGHMHMQPDDANNHPVPTAADAIREHPKANINANGDGNLHLNLDPSCVPVTSMGMRQPNDTQHQHPCECDLPVANVAQRQSEYRPSIGGEMQPTSQFDQIPIPLVGSASNEAPSPLSHDDVDRLQSKAPPQRGVTRGMSGLSTKSDASMGDSSWFNEVQNLASLRNMGDDSRFRLFSENSARYVPKYCRRTHTNSCTNHSLYFQVSSPITNFNICLNISQFIPISGQSCQIYLEPCQRWI
jgi:hypothetical protein